MKWLFLVHRVRTPSSRERVKAWRLTTKVGALLCRHSVDVLPSVACRISSKVLSSEGKRKEGER